MNEYEAKQEARRQRYLDLANKAHQEYEAKHEEAHRMAQAIPFGQPILIGHHSEGRDRRYRGRIHDTFGKAFAALDKSEHYAKKAARVGKGGISSDDPEALQKLRAKLAGLQLDHEHMKAVNKAIRASKTEEERIIALTAIGLTEERARELTQPDYMGRIGYAPFSLANSKANINSTKQRIAILEAAEQRQNRVEEKELYTYREDTAENRVMFEFEGKPGLEIRNVLKRYGFKWSPRRLAWVRYLNRNGIYAAQEVKKQLDALI